MLGTKTIGALAAFVLSTGFVVADPGNLDPYHLPYQSEKGQTGYNNCKGRPDSQDSMCQTLYLYSIDDFCLFAPPHYSAVGDTEPIQVSWCTKHGRGTRVFPEGTFYGAHFIRTPSYLQITGTGDFTKSNVSPEGGGGELDPHGANGEGNPIGGVVVGLNNNGELIQFREWTEFISNNEFCIRACFPAADAWRWCEHIYDEQGCWWNEPGNYDSGYFEECLADNVVEPMGVYSTHGSLSTWYQGWGANAATTTPTPQAAAPSSECVRVPSVGISSNFVYSPAQKSSRGFIPFPTPTHSTHATSEHPKSTSTGSHSHSHKGIWPFPSFKFSFPFELDAEPTADDKVAAAAPTKRAVGQMADDNVKRSTLVL